MATKTIITPLLLKAMRPEIDKALAEVGKRFGVSFKAGGSKYDRSGALGEFKLELAVPTDDGETDPAVVRAISDWNAYASALFNLEPGWLGKTVNHAGKPHKILGLLPNRAKFPVLVSDPTGKHLLLTAEGVSRLMRLADGVAKVAA